MQLHTANGYPKPQETPTDSPQKPNGNTLPPKEEKTFDLHGATKPLKENKAET